MSLKRTSLGGGLGRGAGLGGTDSGAKINKQELYEHLKSLAESGQIFTPVDIALSIGAGEPLVSRALLGLAADGVVEKVETGRYKASPVADLSLADFVKAFARASKVDSTRQRDITEIERLKRNNDIMRSRLLTAQAERDHYLAALKQHGIDPGPAPVVAPASSAADAAAAPVLALASEGAADAAPVEDPSEQTAS